MNEYLVKISLKLEWKKFSCNHKVRTMKIGLSYFTIIFGLITIKNKLFFLPWEDGTNSPHFVYISDKSINCPRTCLKGI